MRNAEESLFFADGYVPYDVAEDDIDRLFSQLQPVKPPPALIARILAQARAQDPFKSPLIKPPLAWENLDYNFTPGKKGKFRSLYL